MTLQSQNLTEASKVENYRFYDLYVEFLDHSQFTQNK